MDAPGLGCLPQRAELPCDEGADHVVRAVSLGAGVGDPHVATAEEDLELGTRRLPCGRSL